LLGSIAVGDAVDIRPEAPVNGTYTARVTVIDDVIDAASGTFRVRAELANPGERVAAGLRCKMTLAVPAAREAPTN
jgi:multidrug efflux pump subunit AcrA (membrane-fusion protein)